MGNFCHVENGEVVYAGHLPKSHKSVSGLDKMDQTTLPSIGWFPMVEVHPDYDSITHYLNGYTIDIQADRVVYTDIIVAFNPDELIQNSKNNIDAKISDLEQLQTPRLLRDAALGTVLNNPGHVDNGKTGTQRLQAIEDAILTERSKL